MPICTVDGGLTKDVIKLMNGYQSSNNLCTSELIGMADIEYQIAANAIEDAVLYHEFFSIFEHRSRDGDLVRRVHSAQRLCTDNKILT